MLALVDQEIAHISRAMRLKSVGELGGPVLSSDYWRKRLHGLLDAYHLTKAQLCIVDSLLLQLDVASGARVPQAAAAITVDHADANVVAQSDGQAAEDQSIDVSDAAAQIDALSHAIAASGHDADVATLTSRKTAHAI